MKEQIEQIEQRFDALTNNCVYASIALTRETCNFTSNSHLSFSPEDINVRQTESYAVTILNSSLSLPLSLSLPWVNGASKVFGIARLPSLKRGAHD